jgi:hypothetical protein
MALPTNPNGPAVDGTSPAILASSSPLDSSKRSSQRRQIHTLHRPKPSNPNETGLQTRRLPPQKDELTNLSRSSCALTSLSNLNALNCAVVNPVGAVGAPPSPSVPTLRVPCDLSRSRSRGRPITRIPAGVDRALTDCSGCMVDSEVEVVVCAVWVVITDADDGEIGRSGNVAFESGCLGRWDGLDGGWEW